MKPPTKKQLEAAVASFNEKSPVGSWIDYREIMPDETTREPGTEAKAYQVKSEAYVHQGHTAAVFLTGKSGFVDVGHCVPRWGPPTSRPTPPPTPELDRMNTVRTISQAQGAFIEFLKEKGLVLCQWWERDTDSDPDDDTPDQFMQITTPMEKLLAEYHEIDLDKCEAERVALLEYCRTINA